jgi:uncharacterized protein YhaN
MTIQEALAVAALAKPKQPKRIAFDKLQSSTTVAQFSAGAEALNKRFDAMGGTVADMQKQIDRARAGVALCADVMKINLTETMK